MKVLLLGGPNDGQLVDPGEPPRPVLRVTVPNKSRVVEQFEYRLEMFMEGDQRYFIYVASSIPVGRMFETLISNYARLSS